MGCGHSVAAPSEGAPAAQTVGRDPANGNTGRKCGFEGVVGNEPTDYPNARDNSRCVFRNALSSAVEQIYLMQRSGNVALDEGEMEEVTALTRGLDNLQANQKEARFSLLGSWRILEKEGTVKLFGQRIYDDMMERDPEIKELLFGIEISEQSKVLTRMFATAVTFYSRQDVMQRMFLAIGAQHRAYGTETRHVNQMEQSFFRVFPAFVGQEVFDHCKEEWHQFWFTLTECFERGSRSHEGDKYGKLRELQMIKQLQEDFALIKQRQDELEPRKQFVGVLYGKAIEMEPNLSRFTALVDLRTSRRVLEFFADIFNSLGDLEKLGQSLEELGARHIAYNVKTEDLRAFTKPFMYACHHFLEDKWSVLMESRFRWVWGIVLEKMSAGMERRLTDTTSVRVPDGSEPFCLLFASIEGGTELWAKNAAVMGTAITKYHAMVRSIIALYDAYEVKVMGDSFMIACANIVVGMKIALAIQLESMRAVPIAPGFKMLKNPQGGGDPSCWRREGLRVRVAMQHCVDVAASYDAIHQRYDYYGPSVNSCSSILLVACGGEILISKESFNALEAMPAYKGEPCPWDLRQLEVSSFHTDPRGMDEFISVTDVGPVELKGISDPVHLLSITPKSLSGRRFRDVKLA